MEGLMWRFLVYGTFSGLWVNVSKTKLALKKYWVSSQQNPVYSGVSLCDSFRYLGIQFGYVSPKQAYTVNMRKVLLRAHVLAKLSLRMEEKVHLLKTRVLPCVLLAARAYYPDDRVVAELRKVYQVALSLSSWGMTLECLSRPPSEGGVCTAPPPPMCTCTGCTRGRFSLHSRSRTGSTSRFYRAFVCGRPRLGLVLEVRFLRFVQLALVRHSTMGFLAWSVRSFSKARSESGSPAAAFLRGNAGVA